MTPIYIPTGTENLTRDICKVLVAGGIPHWQGHNSRGFISYNRAVFIRHNGEEGFHIILTNTPAYRADEYEVIEDPYVAVAIIRLRK